MDKYSVILYPRAFRDIDDIYAYIALEKMSPENAKGQTDRIWDAIKSLEQLPESHQDRLVGQFAGKGYKQLIVDNYIVIFKIDKEQNRVYIVTVQYQGRTILHMRYGYFSEKTFKGYEITDKCIQCGKCERICPQKCIKDFVINQTHCLH